MSGDFFGTHSWWVSTLLSVGSTGLLKVEIYRFLFVTCPLGRCVRWLWGWGPLILSHHPAKFRVHRPCESEDITCLFVTWPLIRCVTWLSGWAPLILSHHPAKFAVDRPYESEYITFFICHVTTKFGVHKSFESGDIPVFICHVITISKYHVTFWVGSSHLKWPPW